MRSDNKALVLFKRVITIPKDLKEFLEGDFNLLVDNLNQSLSQITLSRNFDSHVIKDILIPAGSTSRIDHSLGVIPSFRIILRQTGGGLITDGTFTNKYIELSNAGGSDTTITVALLKE